MDITCSVCPYACVIAEGNRGFCSCYSNVDGVLTYNGNNVFSAVNIEYIDKKPFFHYYPGSKTLSIGSYGCNLRCEFCQNSDISQEPFNFDDIRQYEKHPSLTDILGIIKERKINIIVFTYNEPLLHLPWYKFLIERAKQEDIKILFKTNGFATEKTFDEAIGLANGFNIDLKLVRRPSSIGFNAEGYQIYLNTVFKNIRKAVDSNKHVEISAICIYPRNSTMIMENFDRLFEISDIIPVHLLKYVQFHIMKDPSTLDEDLITWRGYLIKKGFRYVYNGYPSQVQNTYCQYCGKSIVERDGFVPKNKFYKVKGNRAYCVFCDRIIPIIDNDPV